MTFFRSRVRLLVAHWLAGEGVSDGLTVGLCVIETPLSGPSKLKAREGGHGTSTEQALREGVPDQGSDSEDGRVGGGNRCLRWMTVVAPTWVVGIEVDSHIFGLLRLR